MPQGCHLLYSSADRESFDLLQRPERPEDALRERVLRDLRIPTGPLVDGILAVGPEHAALDVQRATVYGLLPEELDRFQQRWAASEGRCEKLGTVMARVRAERQAEFIRGMANPHLSDRLAGAIPGALERIHRHCSSVHGLFEPARANATAWVTTLTYRGKGQADGYAYEVVAAARIIDHPPRSRQNRPLHLNVASLLIFGQKQQASYGNAREIVIHDERGTSVINQPKRRRIEADLTIVQPDGREIGIDFKHTSVGGKSEVKESQLEGARIALITGEIHEFHFASNTAFTAGTLDHVAKANRQIAEHNRQTDDSVPPIELFEHYGY
jgi:hypothetical protein